MSQTSRQMPFETLERLVAKVEEGTLEHKQALLFLTVQAVKRGFNCYGYFDAVYKVLPNAKWDSVNGNEFEVPGSIPTKWFGPADFYAWANTRFGHLLEAGAYLKNFVEATSAEERRQVFDKAQRRMERVQENHRLVKDEGLSLGEAAKKTGCAKSTVHADLKAESFEKTAIAEKSNGKRTQTIFSIYPTTNPSTAAQKIKEKFGRDFSMALAGELLESLKEE